MERRELAGTLVGIGVGLAGTGLRGVPSLAGARARAARRAGLALEWYKSPAPSRTA